MEIRRVRLKKRDKWVKHNFKLDKALMSKHVNEEMQGYVLRLILRLWKEDRNSNLILEQTPHAIRQYISQ